MTQFYTYWEGPSCPKYIDLCVSTWFRQIPDLHLTVINHRNLFEYVGDVYDIERLKRFSLAKQSDAVSAAVLAKFGGTFVDADTIITKDPTETFDSVPGEKMIGFGVPSRNSFHVAVLHAGQSGNPIAVRWMTEASKRISGDGEGGWDYLANQILNPMLAEPAFGQFMHIIDRTASGHILESHFELVPGQAEKSYLKLYFGENDISVSEALDAAVGGMISLHNSWTPASYGSITDIRGLLSTDNLLSRLLARLSGIEETGIPAVESRLTAKS